MYSTESEEIDLAEIIAATLQMYGRQCDETVLTIWLEDLADYPPEAVAHAFRLHRRDPERGRYPPVPSDIIRHMTRDIELRADSAWRKVIKAVNSVGCRMPICFDDPVIHAALEQVGGWYSLRTLSADGSEKATVFKQRYMALAAQKQLKYPPFMAGEYEGSAPVAFGNLKASEAVFRSAGGDPRMLPRPRVSAVKHDVPALPDLSKEQIVANCERLKKMLAAMKMRR